MQTFDGSADHDRRLWQTYMYLAKTHAIRSGGRRATRRRAFVDYRSNRVPESSAEVLQTILFSCFALEYRMKRVLSVMRPDLRVNKPKYNARPMLNEQRGFWHLLKDINRCHDKVRCAEPAGWANCRKTLLELTDRRDKIAHANYEKVLGFLDGEDSLTRARGYYNAVVDALRLINVGTGYDTRPYEAIEEYFRPLKVADDR